MRHKSAFFYAVLTVALFPPIIGAQAQDVVTQTPPELRDFRLDPQNAPPRETAPVTPPPVVPTVEPSAAPATTTPRQAAPSRDTETSRRTEEERPNSRSQNENTPDETTTDNSTDSAGQPTVEPAVDAAEPAVGPEVAPTTPVTDVANSQGLPFPAWILWVALGLAILAGIGFIIRRHSHPSDVEELDAVATMEEETSPIIVPETEIVNQAQLPPVLETPVVTASSSAKATALGRPQLAVTFQPESATVSLANLTVMGRLLIVNEGDAPAQALKLRAALTSATEYQADIVASFHADAPTFPAETLGDAAPGERLDMQIDLQVPLTQLQSFPLGSQRLFVPIVIANLSYGWDGNEDVDVTEIACLIGREAQPPKPKMAPLRLDLGPRSFSGLGQRPLAA